jgi:hypothetical protein
MTNKDYTPPYEQAQSEFESDPGCYVLFATNGLMMGRMIGASKSTYCQEHQGELVIFNANVLTKTHGKVWFGDLNVTLDFDSLKNVADQLGEDLYILMEGDARFGYEKQPIDVLISKARTVIRCNKDLKMKKQKAEKKVFPKLPTPQKKKK